MRDNFVGKFMVAVTLPPNSQPGQVGHRASIVVVNLFPVFDFYHSIARFFFSPHCRE
jgi:hypothetical protein